jgi:hypothetical protein
VFDIDKECLCDEEVFVRFGGLKDNVTFKIRRLLGCNVHIQVLKSDKLIEGKIVSVGTEMIHLDIGLKRMTLPISVVNKVFDSGKKLIYEFKHNEEHTEDNEVNEKK